ncbi:MAG: phytanoyl-CoA dioxygenase family protein [Pseudomonadales bacterium]|jgi:ectoine hydroxylase-related dioxygenase (phytanoyl-CoA dioxygenase family)|nr:phytanoyl-CoA dioxygenase family protein [Pseudomonadales bacterium]
MIRRERGYLAYRDDVDNEASCQLQKEGYTVIRGVFSKLELKTLRSEINRVYDKYSPDSRGPFPTQWHNFRYEMLNRSAACQTAIAHRGILDAIEPLLGEDCHIIANTAWRNPPDESYRHGGAGWHIDAGPHVPLGPGMQWPEDIPHPIFAIGAHLYLKTCRLKDGPTGVIPRTHLSGQPPPQDQTTNEDLEWGGYKTVPLLARAGDVALFVSDVWHRRMPCSKGNQGRFFLQAHYGRRDIAQRLRTTDDTHQLSPDAIARLDSERARTVAGIHPRFFYDG